MRVYRAKRDAARKRVTDKYTILGFISSGTYGRVYKAQSKDEDGRIHAIKKFKPDKEGEIVSYTGISQSAIREMALCSELGHANVIKLQEIILEDKCIFMVFEYAEHDLLQIIHHHTQQPRHPIPPATIKSIMFQLLNGCQYLHSNWVLHRDLKPQNLLINRKGELKLGDFGLARAFGVPVNTFSNEVRVTTLHTSTLLMLILVVGRHSMVPCPRCSSRIPNLQHFNRRMVMRLHLRGDD